MKRTLVTGGAGFIGSHLVERLLSDGHAVTVLDNLSTGRASNLASHRENPRFQFHEVDLAGGGLSSFFEGIDWVFHLAALADIVPSIERPGDYFRANVVATEAVLEASRVKGIKRFVYTASSSCYGMPDQFPTPETASLRPQYPYALTKAMGEEMVLHWVKVYKLPAVSLRLFNVYGPRSRTSGAYGAVFGVFLAQKLAGKPFTVVGDGSQTRDFTYVTDVTEAFVKAAVSSLSGEILNVGSGGTYSIGLLVKLLGGLAVRVPKRPGEPDCTFADVSKIQKLLGWKAQVSFEEGVRRMLERLSDWKEAPVWTPDSVAQATESWFRHLSPTGAEL